MGPRDPAFVTPLVKHLLNTRRLLFRKRKVQEANALADRINVLISDIRSKSLSKLKNGSSRELWQAVKPSKISGTCNYDAVLGNVNAVNLYFSNICTNGNLVQVSNLSADHVYDRVNTRTSTDLISSGTLDHIMVELMLRKVKSTSPGLDNIPSWIFQKCSYELAEVICHIFNYSLECHNIPDQWRKAVVTPIPKTKKPIAISDFRPISVTPILSRVLEKHIVAQYIQPVLPFNLLCDQFAFKPTGSTTCALVYLLHNVTKLLENNSYVRCLTIDFTKAFDVIDHDTLLKKMLNLTVHVSPNIISWISSFLRGRSQVVRYKGYLSDPCSINRGIVQGSGIGPALFAIMISDLTTISVMNLLCKFADDVNLLSPETADIGLDDEFSNICRWASLNKMNINFSKTKEIVFHRPNPRSFIPPINLLHIERVNEIKMLGVSISGSLKFDAHVKSVLSQCSQRLYLLKQLKNQGLPINKLDEVYSALIVSKIRYALPAWGGFLSVNLCNMINGFFKRSFKFHLTSKLYDINELITDSDKTLFNAINTPGHCLHNLLPERRTTQYELRGRGHDLLTPHIQSTLHKSSFINRCVFNFR